MYFFLELNTLQSLNIVFNAISIFLTLFIKLSKLFKGIFSIKMSLEQLVKKKHQSMLNNFFHSAVTSVNSQLGFPLSIIFSKVHMSFTLTVSNFFSNLLF